MSDAQEKSITNSSNKHPFTKSKRKLLFTSAKESRKTKLEIYNTGLIILTSPSSKTGIHIPSRLKEWFNFPSNKEIPRIIVKCNYSISINTQERKLFVGILSEIYHNGYEVYIRPMGDDEKAQEISLLFKEGNLVSCKLPAFIKEQKQLQEKPLFTQAKEMVESIDLLIISSSTPILTFNYKSKQVIIYQSEKKQLSIKVTGRLDYYGDFRITSHLARFIKDWFKREDYFLASLNGAKPIIVPSKIQRKNEGENRLIKCLNFPYWGKVRNAEVIFSNPTLKLTTKALENITIRNKLLSTGIPLKGLLYDIWKTDHHVNQNFSTIAKKILHEFSQTNKNSSFITEVDLELDPTQAIIPLAAKYCFDGLVIDHHHSKPFVYLNEIISTIGNKSKYVIDNEIFHLKHYIALLGVNSAALLFFNSEISSYFNHTIITDYYSLNTGIILMGREKITQCLTEPQYFSELLHLFQTKRRQLLASDEFLVHPLTTQIISKKQLYSEALSVLLQLFPTKRIDRNILSQYCTLMGITISDFTALYEEGQQGKNQMVVREWIYSTFPSATISELFSPPQLEHQILSLLYVHYKLITKESVALLSIKKDLFPLLPYQDFLQALLPPILKIYGILKQHTKGTSYELLIFSHLLAEGYFVLRNVIFTFSGKIFEIDLLALRDNELLLVSCKNHSTITNSPLAERFLRQAACRLEFLCQLVNASSARLYFKANPLYASTLATIYHKTYWEKQVQLFITD